MNTLRNLKSSKSPKSQDKKKPSLSNQKSTKPLNSRNTLKNSGRKLSAKELTTSKHQIKTGLNFNRRNSNNRKKSLIAEPVSRPRTSKPTPLVILSYTYGPL